MSRDKAQRREQIVGAVAQHLLDHGLHNSALRALAQSAGISDRMIMYYFDTKEELISEALLRIANGLIASLDVALPKGQVSAQQLTTALRARGSEADAKPGQRLWFEIVGLAMREDGPYLQVAQQILAGWEDWIRDRLGPRRAHLAPELLAQIEGEMMINLLRR